MKPVRSRSGELAPPIPSRLRLVRDLRQVTHAKKRGLGSNVLSSLADEGYPHFLEPWQRLIAKPAIALLDELLKGSPKVELFATPGAPDDEPGDAPRLSLGGLRQREREAAARAQRPAQRARSACGWHRVRAARSKAWQPSRNSRCRDGQAVRRRACWCSRWGIRLRATVAAFRDSTKSAIMALCPTRNARSALRH